MTTFEVPVISVLASAGAIVIYLAAGVGAFISIVTYLSERKRFRLTSTIEVFRLLSDIKHREARKVMYGLGTLSSYEILGLTRPTAEMGASNEELMTLCRDIVKSDFNEIGTLVHYDLLDAKIFVEEYYVLILKIWDLFEKEIFQARHTRGFSNYMVRLEEMRDKAMEYAKKHH